VTPGVLELGDEVRDAAVVPAGQQLDWFVVVEGLGGADEPDRDVFGVHDAGEAVGHFGELDQPLSALAGRRASPV
jgi:hypothetical protein